MRTLKFRSYDTIEQAYCPFITDHLKRDLYPTMKPVELVAYAIQNSSRVKESVLDLFLGSGSTLIASEQTDRTCYGMELDPKYVDVIRKRYWKLVNNNDETGWEINTPAIKESEK